MRERQILTEPASRILSHFKIGQCSSVCGDGNSPGSELRTTTRVMWEVDGEEGAGLLAAAVLSDSPGHGQSDFPFFCY